MLDSKMLESKEKAYIAKTQKIPYMPISLVSGKGALLYDSDGKEYIDFLASASSANIGHGNEVIAKAVYEQMKKLSQYTFAYFSTDTPILLAEKLAKISPFDDAQVLYSATGSASIDAAIKLVRAYTGRSKIISMCEAYHGSTYGSISLSALSTNMARKIGPLLPEIYHAYYPNKDRDWKWCLDNLEYAFKHYLPAEEVAAIFIEPIGGDMGLIVPPKEWVEGLRKICDREGILLVSDEIQQGLCRAGQWLCLNNFGVTADLYVLGKSLGAGLPMGAVIGPKKIMNSLEPPAHLFTLAGSAAVSAAALANLNLLEEMDANKMSREKGEYLKKKFEELRDKHHSIADIHGIGLNMGVDIIKNGKPDYKTTAKISYYAITHGLLMIFVNQTTLRIQPPLVITYKELDKAIAILDAALTEVEADRIGDEIFNEMQGW